MAVIQLKKGGRKSKRVALVGWFVLAVGALLLWQDFPLEGSAPFFIVVAVVTLITTVMWRINRRKFENEKELNAALTDMITTGPVELSADLLGEGIDDEPQPVEDWELDQNASPLRPSSYTHDGNGVRYLPAKNGSVFVNPANRSDFFVWGALWNEHLDADKAEQYMAPTPHEQAVYDAVEHGDITTLDDIPDEPEHVAVDTDTVLAAEGLPPEQSDAEESVEKEARPTEYEVDGVLHTSLDGGFTFVDIENHDLDDPYDKVFYPNLVDNYFTEAERAKYPEPTEEEYAAQEEYDSTQQRPPVVRYNNGVYILHHDGSAYSELTNPSDTVLYADAFYDWLTDFQQELYQAPTAEEREAYNKKHANDTDDEADESETEAEQEHLGTVNLGYDTSATSDDDRRNPSQPARSGSWGGHDDHHKSSGHRHDDHDHDFGGDDD